VTSRLASLLVQDGLVSPKKMAEAFQRQVIYGGALDTILLEMDLVDEATLVDALGRAGGLPSAGDLPPGEQLVAAGRWFSRSVSERYRAVPIELDGNVLRVLITDPPDRRQLDELGYMLSYSIDPILVPEYRFAQAVELVYQTAMPARLASLSKKLRVRGGAARPVPRRAVTVEPLPSAPPVTVEKSRTVETPMVIEQIAEPEDFEERVTMKSMPVVAPTSINPSLRDTIQEPPLFTEPPPGSPEHQRAVVSDLPIRAQPAEAATARIVARQADAPRKPVAHEVAVRVHDEPPLDATPLALADAQKAMDEAGDRDAIFEALCRGARSQLPFAAIFTVHSDLAAGRLALGDRWLARVELAQVSVPLDRPSSFRTAVNGRAPYLGRVGEEVSDAQALTALGRRPPLPALLVPIVMRDRAVALLYADGAGGPIDSAAMTELSTAVAGASRAFQRLILRAKSGDYARAGGAPAAKVAPEAVSEPRAVDADKPRAVDADKPRAIDADKPRAVESVAVDARPSDGPQARAVEAVLRQTIPWHHADAAPTAKAARGPAGGRHTLHGLGPGSSIHDLPTERVKLDGNTELDAHQLVERVAAGGDGALPATAALLALGERGLEALVEHLPGPLRLDRHALRGPIPPLHEHGPLLAVLSRFGAAAAPYLTARLSDPSLEVRYYATLACGELKLADVVVPLGQRLLDPDAGVRHAAVAALARFDPLPEVRTLLESLRGELPGPDPVRQRYASEALGVLRDVPSVPRLIELVKHADASVVAAARRALVEITKQDFGTSRWRWRGWWDRHRHEPRVEWMLEGLGHAEAEVRQSASEELKNMTPSHFGYQFDLPRREREEARRKWVDWWRANKQVDKQ
jgi:hypothetical protein